MKRIVPVLAALIALSLALPAHAYTVLGHVKAAAMTPTLPRTMYLADARLNGVTGYVAKITPSALERDFTLLSLGTTGDSGPIDLDIWFYTDIAGTGTLCKRDALATADGGETGTMCAGAEWAIVVLFSGNDVSFRLTY